MNNDAQLFEKVLSKNLHTYGRHFEKKYKNLRGSFAMGSFEIRVKWFKKHFLSFDFIKKVDRFRVIRDISLIVKCIHA